MYHKIGIQRLSPSQISKLLNGHRIRVKHGSGHEIHASAEQHKKIMAAHRKGKAHTLQFDPYQMAQHQHMRHGHHAHHAHHAHGYGEGEGEGFLDMAGSVARAVAPMAIDYGAHTAKKYITGRGRAGRRRRGKGEGLLGSAARALAPVAIDYGAQALKRRFGHGPKPAPKPAPKPTVKYVTYTPAEEEAARALLELKRGRGDGIRRRGRKSHGEALYPAGYGEGMVYPRGCGEGEGVRRRGRKSHGEGRIGSMIGSHLGSLAGNFLPF